MIESKENVARAIFSPRIIYNGELQPEAFQLREGIAEEYISVMRMAVEGWQKDILLIPQRKNRQLYGYAEMNVGEIRNAGFMNVAYDVKECESTQIKSHVGIYITVGGNALVGGVKLPLPDTAHDFLLLAIQRRLVEIARRKLHTAEEM